MRRPCRAATGQNGHKHGRVRRREIGDEEIDRAVALGLHSELAVELQRGAEQHRQHDHFGKQPGDGRGIVMALENGIEHGPELDGATAHIQTLHLKGDDMIIAGEIELAEGGCSFCHGIHS